MVAFEACCSLLYMMCGDPVYRVYVAALVCISSFSIFDNKIMSLRFLSCDS